MKTTASDKVEWAVRGKVVMGPTVLKEGHEQELVDGSLLKAQEALLTPNLVPSDITRPSLELFVLNYSVPELPNRPGKLKMAPLTLTFIRH